MKMTSTVPSSKSGKNEPLIALPKSEGYCGAMDDLMMANMATLHQPPENQRSRIPKR